MKTLILFSLFSLLLSAQSEFNIKQITYMNSDCRNFYSYKNYNYNKYLYVFESHLNNSVNIILGEYSIENDSFRVLLNVTDNNFININPKITEVNSDSVYIIYQTNINGNWDIAYKILYNNNLSEEFFIANTEFDETNPSTMYTSMYYWQHVWVAFERENSIFIKDLKNNEAPFPLFEGMISYKFSHPTLSYSVFSSEVVFASKLVQNNENKIVFKKLNYNGQWGNDNIITIGSDINNLRIVNLHGNLVITFDSRLENKSNIYLIQNLNEPNNLIKLKDDYEYDISDFHSDHSFIITLREGIDVYNSHTYKVERNDSLFIRVNYFDIINFFNYDTLIYTKVKNNNLHIGSFGMTWEGEIYYTVWEDSINGKIQLFGRKGIEVLGNVENETFPTEFSLSQNYPNPFNPNTLIEYVIASDKGAKQSVTLKVYDILGNEIAALVNEEKSPGNYSVQFNGSSLPSGIYFYQLRANNFVETKKMILLK